MTNYEISLQSAIMADPNIVNHDAYRVYGKDIFVKDDEVIYTGYEPVKLKKEIYKMQEDGTLVEETVYVAAYEPAELAEEGREAERAARVTKIDAKSTVVITPLPVNVDKNKYFSGEASSFEVKITPNATMVGLCGANNVLVNIDDKIVELSALGADKPIVFSMDCDHRISINWIHNEVVETFRFICGK